MRFVDQKRLPLDLLDFLQVFEDHLVRREQDVELELLRCPPLVLADHLPGGCGTQVADDVHVWCPLGKLLLPGGNGREGNDD